MTVSLRISRTPRVLLAVVLLALACLALAALVVRAVTSRQEARAARVSGGGLALGVMPFAAEPSFDTSKSIPPPTAA